MGPISLPSGKEILAGLSIAAAFVIAASVGGTKLYEHFTENKRTDQITVHLSEGRSNLLKEGLAGTSSDLSSYLTVQTEEYFKLRGLPCDPGSGGNNLVETLNKAQCHAPAKVAP